MTGTDFGGDNDTAYNAFVQSDGRIVAVGFGDPLVDPGLPSEQYPQGFTLARFNGARLTGGMRLRARRLRRHPRLPRHVAADATAGRRRLLQFEHRQQSLASVAVGHRLHAR